MAVRWRVSVTAQADADIEEIALWTESNFGSAQAEAYARLIAATLRDLEFGPDRLGVRKRDDLVPGLRLIHVARHGHHASHFVVFRVASVEARAIEVLRILHDQMDIIRHIRSDGER